ncbi:MAG: TIR domain-containing protein [Devosia sp.]
MPDIFISYKKEERETASALATRLTEAGYDVWWDDALLAGERYEDEIASVLDRSHAVVVLWSRQSVKSEWVKAEAEAARQQKKALPIIIDDMPPTQMPLLYRGMHAARFEGWTGDTTHPGYVELIGSIRDRIGRAAGPKLSEAQAEAKLEQSVDVAKAMLAEAAATPPENRPAVPPPPVTVRRPSPLRWIALGLLALIAMGGLGTFVYLQMSALSPDDRAKVERCTAWPLGATVDWATTIPPLVETAPDDCARAVQLYPDSGDYLGMLAMARIAQGAPHSGEAVALANRAIDKGGPIGNYAMGVMYDRGINFTIDYARAATYFKTAADMGMPRAQGRLCLMGIDARMVLPIAATREELGAYCTKGAAANDSFALLATGYAYESGIDGRVVNPAAAAEYYDRASKLGDSEAMVRLGILNHRGWGVARDANRAVALYQQAADNGDPGGLRSLAVSLETGDGIPQDVNRAGQLYERASVRRDIPALLLAGYGIGPPSVLTSRQQGDAEILASAGPGVETGHRIRGLMLAYGNLRTRDTAAAETELKACADVGNSMCEAMLGYFYQAGLNGTADAAKAAELYESSASKGNLYGQYYLAWITELGNGVTQDMGRAVELYRLAAAQGHLTSINQLQQLGQPLS